jgi:DNA (cytosine-5)-methyltransferase 1
MAGVQIVGGIDAWDLATETFALNFPDAQVFHGRAENLKPRVIAEKVGTVDLLLASPECTNHSVAKGGLPRCEKSRATAFQVLRYAKVLQPRWIVVENVVNMRTWARFEEWLQAIRALGYHVTTAIINAKDHRTPQSRRRLFVLCDKVAIPTGPPRCRGRRPTAASVLGAGQTKDLRWNFRPLLGTNRAKPTLARARRAKKSLGNDSEFIMVYYGSDAAGGFQTLDRPLRTVTTLDRFAYVRPNCKGHEMRMLQPPELAAAMGFPADHKFPETCRRNKIKLIGNAVCPLVMRDVVAHLTGRS